MAFNNVELLQLVKAVFSTGVPRNLGVPPMVSKASAGLLVFSKKD